MSKTHVARDDGPRNGHIVPTDSAGQSSRNDSWVRHRRRLIESPAWRSLGINERRILDCLEIECCRHSGKRVRLRQTYSNFVEGGVRRQSIKPGIRKLEERGLVEVVGTGLYRLTYLGEHPSDEWVTWAVPEAAPRPVPEAIPRPVPEAIPRPVPEAAPLSRSSSTSSRVALDEATLRHEAGLKEKQVVHHFSAIVSLHAEGCDLELDILPILREKRPKAKDVHSWRFYAPAIQDHREARKRAVPPAEKSPQEKWQVRIAIWCRARYWHPAWGPMPYEAGCQIPAHLMPKEGDQTRWRRRYDEWVRSKSWSVDWGPAPGHLGCNIPSPWLAEWGMVFPIEA